MGMLGMNMKVYFLRLGWYLVLAPMTLLASRGESDFVRGALFPAIAMYIPVSFSWLVMSYFMYPDCEFQEQCHKKKLKMLLYGVISLGLFICLSYLLHESADLAQFGCILALMGTEGVIVLHEHIGRRAFS